MLYVETDYSKTYAKLCPDGTMISSQPTPLPRPIPTFDHRFTMKHFAFTIALSPIWLSWLSSLRLGCRVKLNREHIIPRSLLPRKVTETVHNIIGFPDYLNSKRGTLKYCDSKKPGMPIWPCRNCKSSKCALMGKINKDGFTPPSIYKPIIGASVLRSMYNFPELTQILHNEVLDIGVAMSWVNSSFDGLPYEIKQIFYC